MPSRDMVLAKLRSLSNSESLKGMSRFGIETKSALGVSIPKLRSLAREVGKDHALAEALWTSRVHEARILASMVDEPAQVTEAQMDRWVKDFDSWDVCDQCCSNLFDKVAFARAKAVEWSAREEEYVKRAGFVLMASMAVHDKAATDADFLRFLPLIKQASGDERNFVKKAVNWALRQIGKRNAALNRAAIKTAKEIQSGPAGPGRWIASDALRELQGEAVQRKLARSKSA